LALAKPLSILELARRRRQRLLGPYGAVAEDLYTRKSGLRKQNYSVSLLAAISPTKVLATQLVEGGVDAAVFENFIQAMLTHLGAQPELAGRRVVLLLDNARIHHHSLVLETARSNKVNVLFNSEYSPWLNPVEQLFNRLKSRVKEEALITR